MDSNVLHEISQLQFHPSHTPYTQKKSKGIAGHHKKEEEKSISKKNPNSRPLIISKISNLPFLNASDTATGAE